MSGKQDWLTPPPLWNQMNDARAKNLIDRKHESRMANQPFALILGQCKNGLIFVECSETNESSIEVKNKEAISSRRVEGSIDR